MADRIQGRRYGLIVFIVEASVEAAKIAARVAISEAGWRCPDVRDVFQVDGKMRIDKFAGLEEPIRRAVSHGSSIVVFGEPVD
jgi:hypothetical protein